MKRRKLFKNQDQVEEKFKPPLFRIFLWFALGSIILFASIPRILSAGGIHWAPIAGAILGFFGVGMGLAQILYLIKQN